MSKGLDDYKIISVLTTMAEIKRQQKEHKALEIIIKNKMIRLEEWEGFSQEEYDLLKEVLL